MSKEEAEALIKQLKENNKKNTSSKANAIKALIDAGLVDSQGNPTKPYRV